jgi:uncharacterized RDD family membrane protein YckC
MKCPKCQYLTYDQSGRCRNCGYEFSLAVDDGALDLPIRTGDEPIGPLADFTLSDTDSRGSTEAPPSPVDRGAASRHAPSRTPSSDLPLFYGPSGSDAPLVSLPAAPRAPVSVRKSTATRPPVRRSKDDAPTLDLDGANPTEPEPVRPAIRSAAAVVEPTRAEEAAAAAPLGPRLFGGLVDIALMGGIDLAILYFTLQLSDLTFADVGVIPKAPFIAFLALLNGGYLTAFTAAGGQSIGKMLAGTRVVTTDEAARTDRATLGQSALRAVGYVLSALPAGLGFLPALFGPDHRGFHDRLAHTRVVRA